MVGFEALGVGTTMENDILHICKSANCIEEKLWSNLPPNCPHKITLPSQLTTENIYLAFTFSLYTYRTFRNPNPQASSGTA
jgi:hypothetical protein